MRNQDKHSSVNRIYGRRSVLKAGAGAATLTAGGILSVDNGLARRAQTADSTLPEDAASEQVLRAQMGSAGSSDFTLQPLSGGGSQQWYMGAMFLPPLYFDVDLNLQPGIFDTWQSNEDATTWTFTIDPRATWSDGSAITASDVKGSWELMATPILENSRIEGYLGEITGFDSLLVGETDEASGLAIIDDHTIEVQLAKSDPVFHWRIATVHLVPVKIEQAQADPENFWRPENNPLSSGPYMLESFDPDQGIATLGKNPNWWMGEGQYLDQIEIRYVTDPGTVAIMVRNNEFDVTQQDMPLELQAEVPDFFTPVKAFGFDTFWLVPTVEPTNDINIRKALTHSVNFEDVFTAAFPQGGATFASQFLDADFPCVDTEQSWYAYDPDAAREALAASEYGSAENLPRLRVTPRGANPVTNRALESVIEFWRQNLGITNVQFEQQQDAFGSSVDEINLTRDDNALNYPDAAVYLWQGAHSAGPFATGTLKGYHNDTVDELLDQALSIPPEDSERCELTLEAQRIFMDDYVTMIYGVPETYRNSYSYVRNYEKGPDRSPIQPWLIYIADH